MKGHSKHEHYTKCYHWVMKTDAWKALSPTAQALYPWLKLEWKGDKKGRNNNGEIFLSVRQAAAKMGVSKDTAARAFQDLQAKGFILPTRLGELGVAGKAKCPLWELTELPRKNERRPSALFVHWRLGNDYPVQKTMPSNIRTKK